MKFLRVQQNTQEWRDLRSTKIGASDAPIIMGLSPWKTPLQLFNEKNGLEESAMSYAMQRGMMLEDEARSKFEDMTGMTMIPTVVQSDQHDFMIASLDGMSLEQDAIVEIKTPGKETISMAKEGKIPDHYNVQIQHQLYVTQLPKAYYFVYDGKDGVLMDIQRDDELIEELVREETAFYRNLREGIAPKERERDFVQRDDEQWAACARRYLELKAECERLEKEMDNEKKSLIAMAEGRNSRGSGIQLSSSYRKGAVDAERIAKVYGVDLEQFRKKGSFSHRILVCNAKG